MLKIPQIYFMPGGHFPNHFPSNFLLSSATFEVDTSLSMAAGDWADF